MLAALGLLALRLFGGRAAAGNLGGVVHRRRLRAAGLRAGSSALPSSGRIRPRTGALRSLR